MVARTRWTALVLGISLYQSVRMEGAERLLTHVGFCSCSRPAAVCSVMAGRRALKAVLIDLSGTLHVEDTAVPGAQEALDR